MKKIEILSKKIKYVYLSIYSFAIVSILNIKPCLAIGGTGGKFIHAFNELSDYVTKLTNGLLAFTMLSSIAIILYHIVQLALVGNNPGERSKVLKNLLTSVICMALLGSISLVMSFIMFYTGV